MRHASVRLSEEALSDLEDIFFLLIDNGADVAVGLRYLGRIRQRCAKIGDAPQGYPLRPRLGPGIRLVPFERSATIVYRLSGGDVEIVRVLYGGRDYENPDLFG
jgi:toxin ParE1/3/4